MSSCASPGGSSALRTRCTRRSELVTVPSASHHDAEPGSTTSAILAVLVRIDVEHDHVVEALEQSQRARHVGLRLGWVLPDHEQCPQLAVLHRLEHLGQVPARLGRDRGGPQRLELLAGDLVDHVLETRQLVRERAHVAAALHVVLPAQRAEAGAVAADLPGEQRQVAEREHVVDAVVMLGDAERPAQLGGLGGGVACGRARGSSRPARRSPARRVRASSPRPTPHTPRSCSWRGR